MGEKKIIMNYSIPPGLDDIEAMAGEVLEALPDELLRFCDGVTLVVEDFPDTATETELELDDSYDLLALFKSGKEISPGIEKKIANDDDLLLLYRRPILDMWCESEEDLSILIRHVMIEELGRSFDFSEEEVDDMNKRHFQGML